MTGKWRFFSTWHCVERHRTENKYMQTWNYYCDYKLSSSGQL